MVRKMSCVVVPKSENEVNNGVDNEDTAANDAGGSNINRPKVILTIKAEHVQDNGVDGEKGKTKKMLRVVTDRIKKVARKVKIVESPSESELDEEEKKPKKKRTYKRRKKKTEEEIAEEKKRKADERKQKREERKEERKRLAVERKLRLECGESDDDGDKSEDRKKVREKKTAKLDARVEQRTNIRFMVKSKRSATETYDALKEVYGSEALSRSQVFKWHKLFQQGRKDVGDAKRAGRPVTKKTSEVISMVKQILEVSPTISIRAIADRVNANKETVRKILLFDLKIKKKVACRKGVKLVRKNKFKEEQIPQQPLVAPQPPPQMPPANIMTSNTLINSNVSCSSSSDVYQPQGFSQVLMYPQSYSGYQGWRDSGCQTAVQPSQTIQQYTHTIEGNTWMPL